MGRLKSAQKALSELLGNLRDGKAVYREKFFCICRVENVRLTSRYVQATAIPILQIEIPGRSVAMPSMPWKFGSDLEYVEVDGDKIAGSYGGWTIWCDPERVQRVEFSVRQADFEAMAEALFA